MDWKCLGYLGYWISQDGNAWENGSYPTIIKIDYIDLIIGNQTVISVIEINWILIMANDGWLGDDESQKIFSIIGWMKHYC
jgi:hypothetical protein